MLITPFRDDFSLDTDALRRIVQMQVEAGIHGIAPLGVTGENTLMTDEEVKTVMKVIVDTAGGKLKIIPDTCAMSLWKAIERVKMYNDMGADYISVFVPFFILPKPDGLIDFYSRLADISKVPIVLHSAKARSGVEITAEVIAALARHPNIAGIKDGNKELDHLTKVVLMTKDLDFKVFTAKDTTAFPLMAFGGAGTFTVSGNIIPGVMKKMTGLMIAGNTEEAGKIHDEYFPVFEAMRWETNPMAAKKGLELMGKIHGALRSPLTPLSEGKSKQLKTLLENMRII